jgi:hypothetical protein
MRAASIAHEVIVLAGIRSARWYIHGAAQNRRGLADKPVMSSAPPSFSPHRAIRPFAVSPSDSRRGLWFVAQHQPGITVQYFIEMFPTCIIHHAEEMEIDGRGFRRMMFKY